MTFSLWRPVLAARGPLAFALTLDHVGTARFRLRPPNSGSSAVRRWDKTDAEVRFAGGLLRGLIWGSRGLTLARSLPVWTRCRP